MCTFILIVGILKSTNFSVKHVCWTCKYLIGVIVSEKTIIQVENSDNYTIKKHPEVFMKITFINLAYEPVYL